MAAKILEIQHFSEALHVISLEPTGFKICLWCFFHFFSHTIPNINAFLHFTKKFNMAAKNGGKAIFVKGHQYTLQIPCRLKISLKSLYLADSHTVSKDDCIFAFYAEI